MNLKNIIIGIILVGLVFFGIEVKYFKNHSSHSATTPNQKVRIGLNPWIGNGIYFFAEQQGIFKKNGLDVDLVEYDDNSVGKQLISSNNIDVLNFTPDVLVNLRAAGADVQTVAVTDNSEGADGIIATEKFKTLADLKGQSIAFESGSTSQLLLAQMLKQAGLSLSDITPINMPAGDAGAAFVAGKVDVAVTWEPWLSKAAIRQGGHILASSKELSVLPDFLMFRTDFIKQHPDAVKKFIESYFDAVALAKQNPEKIISSLSQKYSLTHDETVNMIKLFSWFDLTDNQKKFAPENSPAWQITSVANETWLAEKIIPSLINIHDAWNNSFILSFSNDHSH